MIEYILFGIGITGYVVNLLIKLERERLEDSLFTALRIISDASKVGEAPESAIKRISEMKEPCAKIFKIILNKINSGQSFAKAILETSKKYKSYTLTMLARVLIDSQEYGTDYYKTINEYSRKLWTFKHLDSYARESTESNLLILKVVAVLILPAVFYFFPFIIEEVTIPAYSYFFFSGLGVIIGLMSYIVYDELIDTLVNVPLLASLPLLLPKIFEMVNIF